MAALARWVGVGVLLPMVLAAPACTRRALDEHDAGTGTVIFGAADARIDLAVFDLAGGAISEDDWQAMIAPRAGVHAVDDRASSRCQPTAIGQDYAVSPIVLCHLLSDYTNPVYACSVAPYCTRHDECRDYPRGSCRGQPRGQCAYPGTVQVPCASDADCTAAPDGVCPPNGDDSTACYPTGRCDPPGRRFCGYASQACTSDAECTGAPGGHCSKLILFTQCQYQICMTDADCEAGTRCLCDDVSNACIPADCQADSDCGAGHQCLLLSNCFGSAYHCSTDLDSCHRDTDCGTGQLCRFTDARWQCQPALCGDPA